MLLPVPGLMILHFVALMPKTPVVNDIKETIHLFSNK